jgi:cyclophilin family peptidyl-prolyl cis-trans isomerase
MIAYSRTLFLLTAAALLTGCSKQSETGGSSAARLEHAPDTFKVKFETSKGDFILQVNKDWAPIGVERFFALVQSGFYDNARFFRVIPGFMVQFGIAADPTVQAKWRASPLPDDPVKQSNGRGKISFAMAGPGSRTTQVFINLVDNARLDSSGFAPFGEVVSGMEVVDQLYSGYGEGYPNGNGPRQDLIQSQGNAYLEKDFPRLDFIKKATIQ